MGFYKGCPLSGSLEDSVFLSRCCDFRVSTAQELNLCTSAAEPQQGPEQDLRIEGLSRVYDLGFEG